MCQRGRVRGGIHELCGVGCDHKEEGYVEGYMDGERGRGGGCEGDMEGYIWRAKGQEVEVEDV